MEKPEKHPIQDFYSEGSKRELKGRNESIDAYEAFLPDKNEILEMLGLVYTYERHSHKTLDANLMIDIAKAIAKRLGKEE